MSYNQTNPQSGDDCGTNVVYPEHASENNVVTNHNYDARSAQIPSDCGNYFSLEKEAKDTPVDVLATSKDNYNLYLVLIVVGALLLLMRIFGIIKWP